jgi:hypothetical protein
VDAGADRTLRGHDGCTPHELAVRIFGPDDPMTTETEPT